MYIDLTHTFTADMPVFPGDPSPSLVKITDIAKDGILHYELKSEMHVGTHIDAPSHILGGGKHLDEFGAEKFFGRGVIVDACGKTSADEDLLSNLKIQKGDIVLVCFGWSKKFRDEDYYPKHPELTQEFAQKLVELDISIVGMDTPSPDREPYSVHKILLKHDILIIESLTNLEQLINKPNFEIIALPPKFQAEAAPVRVVAKIDE